MNKMDATEDELPEWLWDIVEKHDIGTRADTARGGALVLLADAHGLVQEIVAATTREKRFTPTIKRQLHKVVDMLIDAERLSSMPH